MRTMPRIVYTLLALAVLVAGCMAAASVESISTEEELESGIVFVKFFAPWCGHCKKMAPTWVELAERAGDAYRVAEVDCTQHQELCAKNGVRGYPTLILFKDGVALEERYGGQRTLDSFALYVEKLNPELPKTAVAPPLTAEESAEEVRTDDAGVYLVTSGNFAAVTEGRDVFFRFHAPWCGHCKNMADAWKDLARYHAKNEARIADVDCTQQKTLCSDFGVRGFPTLIFLRANGDRVPYPHGGDRSLDKLDEFMAWTTTNE